MKKLSVEKNINIELEDDTLREGLHHVSATRPSVEQACDLLMRMEQIGIEHVVLGFPAISSLEVERVSDLLKFISQKGLKIQPWVLCRVDDRDVEIVQGMVSKNGAQAVGVSFFRSVSERRAEIDGTTPQEYASLLEKMITKLKSSNCIFSANLEDSSATSDEALLDAIVQLNKLELYSVVLCDTAGISRPHEVFTIIQNCRRSLNSFTKLVWHGHNDLGLAQANGVAAIEGGVDIVSGTFLGLGERAGNLPLEQMVLYLTLFKSKSYKIEDLFDMSERVQRYFGVSVPGWQPVVGSDIFKTQAGTHGSALIKSRTHIDSENRQNIFSPIAPEKLGRRQEYTIGPLSGKRLVKEFVSRTGVQATEDLVEELLMFAKTRSKPMSDQEVREWLQVRLKRSGI